MERDQLDIRLSHHAFSRADEREIELDKIYSCIRTGRTKNVGKQFIKYTKKYDDEIISCICQIRADCIWIITVMRNEQ